MRRSARFPKIDYNIYNKTGQKVEKDIEELPILFQNISLVDVNMEQTLLTEIELIQDDISDFLDENKIDPNSTSMGELDNAINRINDYRSEFRRKHKELKKLSQEYDAKYVNDFDTVLNRVKEFINSCNDIRHKLRLKEHAENQVIRSIERKQIQFITEDITRCMDEIHKVIKVHVKELKDDEITRRKTDIPEVRKKVTNLSKRIPDLMERIAGEDSDVITQRYKLIVSEFSEYEEHLKSEISIRELEKESLFKEGRLNIKLGKYKGYDSVQDIYSFQDDFEKVYSKTTPKRLMCDVLRNNHLEEPALSLVKSLECIDDAWYVLKQAYGDPKTMLSRKVAQLSKLDSMYKSKDADKIANILGKTISLMREMVTLCEKHHIEASLYHGNVIDQIYLLMGDSRVTRWLSISVNDDFDEEDKWKNLVSFLEKELKIQQQRSLVIKKRDFNKTEKQQEKVKRSHHVQEDKNESSNKNKKKDDAKVTQPTYSSTVNLKCAICSEEGHVPSSGGPGGSKVIQYFACKSFVEMTPQQRFTELYNKNLCFQCLFPHAAFEGRHRYGKCQRDFACPHESHAKYRTKKHVLVCEEHKDDEANKQLLEAYKERYILKQKTPEFPDYSKNIKLSFFTYYRSENVTKKDEENSRDTEDIIYDQAIYMLQKIKIKNQIYTLFYDSGCGDFVSRKSAVDSIGERAKLEYNGPVRLGGVGGISTETPHGIYSVKLPLKDGKEATMAGVCLNQITCTFPEYPINGTVLDDIHDEYRKNGGSVGDLPKLPAVVGGSVDFMIGIKYLRYHPKPVFTLPSGLTIYRSMFLNFDGSDGVIGGPHEVFTNIANQANHSNESMSTFLCSQMQMYRNGYLVDPDVSVLGYKASEADMVDNHKDDDVMNVFTSRRIKLFIDAENTGTQITYRCIKCRSCKVCKDHDDTEEISIKEEAEQELINSTVFVDTERRETVARLPFIQDPKVKLAGNKHKAMKVYQQQMKKLQNNPKDKDDIIKSEQKLQSLGHVDYLRNLTTDQQRMLRESDVQNFIAWRAVWKLSSISTPCRIVFDASQATDTGYSLNDLLAKGRNNMNKLQEIVIRWMMHRVAFHTDVQKMYNTVKLIESDWCYQRYIWQENLDPNMIPEEKIIKTLIYGVKSSGNQAEQGLRQTAKLSEKDYPEVSRIVCKDVYVDDCLSGAHDVSTAQKNADELELVLNRGGFTLKGVSISGENPHEKLSDDGESVSVAGMKWYPKSDVLTLDINPLCFAKKIRGRKLVNEDSMKVPTKLTRRQCASKVAEVFDLTGKVAPLVSSLKIDLHDLVLRKLEWDDVIPDNLRGLWLDNFSMIQEMKNLRYNRTIVPPDAVNLNISTLDFGDSSKQMACAAIYARFERSNGLFSCQLVLARSKIIPENTTQPRAEMIAALLNTHTGEVVRRAFGDKHSSHAKIGDSQIVLYWLKNEEKTLKEWVRNRVLEVKRFTQIDDWYYTESSNMIADIGTRKGSGIDDVNNDSPWIQGYKWMNDPICDMPLQSVKSLQLQKEDIVEARKESTVSTNVFLQINEMNFNKDRIKDRYEYSNYLIDPNRFSFTKVVRILAIVINFIKRIKKRKVKMQSLFNDEDFKESEYYFYKKGTNEVKKFNPKNSVQKFSREKDGILWYTGRILPDDEVTITGRYTAAMLDLSLRSFCVPVLDKYSPIAFSIVNDVHWNNKNASQQRSGNSMARSSQESLHHGR